MVYFSFESKGFPETLEDFCQAEMQM